MEKKDEVVVGVPVYENEYQRGVIPPNAVVGDPKGIPIHQTIYRDTPAPFNCPYCGTTALTTVGYAILFSSISDQIKFVLYYPIKLEFHETIMILLLMLRLVLSTHPISFEYLFLIFRF